MLSYFLKGVCCKRKMESNEIYKKIFLTFVVPGNRVETSCLKRWSAQEEQIFGLILPKVTKSVLYCVWLLGSLGMQTSRAGLLPCYCIPWFQFVNAVDLFSLRSGTAGTLAAPFLREPGHNLSITAAVSHPSVTVRKWVGILKCLLPQHHLLQPNTALNYICGFLSLWMESLLILFIELVLISWLVCWGILVRVY